MPRHRQWHDRGRTATAICQPEYRRHDRTRSGGRLCVKLPRKVCLCSNVEFHYEYEDGHTWSSYWPEVLAVFAVNQNLNGDDDVIVIDREKADLLIDTFWMILILFTSFILNEICTV